MLKTIDNLAAGDFVLLNEPSARLALSRPWRVLGVAGPRVYIDDPARPKRYVARKSVRLVLTDAETAHRVFEFEHENAEEFTTRTKVLETEHRTKLKAFLASLEVSATAQQVSEPVAA